MIAQNVHTFGFPHPKIIKTEFLNMTGYISFSPRFSFFPTVGSTPGTQTMRGNRHSCTTRCQLTRERQNGPDSSDSASARRTSCGRFYSGTDQRNRNTEARLQTIIDNPIGIGIVWSWAQTFISFRALLSIKNILFHFPFLETLHHDPMSPP